MSVSQNVNVVKTLTELGDIVDNLLLLLSEKEKFVINKRFNLDGNGKHTLDQIGKKYSVTRERIRQIEKNALAKMKRNVFNTALKHLHGFVGDIVELNGGIIREKNLVESLGTVLPSNLKADYRFSHLACVLHENLECVGNTINFFPYVRKKNIPDYSLKYTSNKLVNQLQRYGDVIALESVFSDLMSSMDDIDFDIKKMRSLISIDKRITILEGDFIGLLEWRHVHPRTLREKILYVLRAEKKPLHFNFLAEKISEMKFDGRPVNLQAVHNELIRHDQFVLIGRGIYALKDWGFEKGTVADVIVKVLNGSGELGVDEIVDLVLQQRQIKRITILLALKNSDLFERTGRKRYKLKKN